MEKRNQQIYEMLKKNKSLEPIADLVKLVMIAKNTAVRADEVGDKLSVFACRAETAQDDIPPVTAWMDLCDKYKDGARKFAEALREAVKASEIGRLQENLEIYTNEIVEKTAQMIAEDDDFRRAFEQTMRECEEDDDE